MPHAISDYDRKLHQPFLYSAMRSSLEIGDQVTTIGGVIGRVVAIKDDTFVLETGADRVKIRFTKNAISSVEKLNMDNAPKK